MKKWAHTLVAVSFIGSLFFTICEWSFQGSSEATMSYSLSSLSYKQGANAVKSQIDNMALFWLAIGLSAIQFALAWIKMSFLLTQKIYNASALLSSALIFSLAVTAYRAEASVSLEVVGRSFGLASWLLIFGWLCSVGLFLMHRRNIRLREQTLTQ